MTSEQDCGGNLRPELREIIQSLLDAVGYVSPREKMEPTNLIERIRNALNVKIRSSYRGTEDCDLDVDSISKKAASVVEFFYFDHGFEQKMSFELYAWFFFYIDDIASGSRDILENFHRALLQGKAELLPAPLARFPSVLASLYDHWDPLAAAMMATSALDFITGTALEQRRHVVAMEPSVHAPNWPGFLRTKSGMATGFSCAAFPRSDVPGVASYIQALPDMDQLMCLTNDILSYYKEELAGETMGFVPLTARITGKSPFAVLRNMVQEVRELHHRIAATLSGDDDALQKWRTLEQGFVAWHLAIDRFRLCSDYGFVW
ncbi:unnamed protein product [Mycena citricolor]|uniref:Terpene synthase n=1 Tax=Mycena citricolor TaxID=2018698 RepID=A0AAD2H6K9_9AGAR|nr:unnamed protein product [Mycena citricolor]